MFLALRGLPEKMREWLLAKRDIPGKDEAATGPSDAMHEQPGCGDGSSPARTDRVFMACGQRARDKILERR